MPKVTRRQPGKEKPFPKLMYNKCTGCYTYFEKPQQGMGIIGCDAGYIHTDSEYWFAMTNYVDVDDTCILFE